MEKKRNETRSRVIIGVSLTFVVINLLYSIVALNFRFTQASGYLWKHFENLQPFAAIIIWDTNFIFGAFSGILLLLGMYLIYQQLTSSETRPRSPIMFLAILTIYLGWLGVLIKENFNISLVDSLYEALGLFSHSADTAFRDVPLVLNWARFLALAVTVAAVLSIVARRFGDWLVVQMTFKPRVIICGLGLKGSRLAQSFIASGKKVVILELNKDNDEIRGIRAQGGIVLIGNATDPYFLKFAGINKAEFLIASTESDETNIEIASKAYQLKNRNRNFFQCFVHVNDIEKTRLFKRHQIFSGQEEKFDARIFNVADNAARLILDLEEYRPDETLFKKKAGQYEVGHEVKILLAGDGKLAFYMIKQMASVCHYGNTQKTTIKVFKELNCTVEDDVLKHLPGIDQILDLDFYPIQNENKFIPYEVEEVLDSFSLLYVCFDNEISGFRFLTKLMQQDVYGKVKVIFCIPQSSSLTELLQSSHFIQNLKEIKFFRVLDESCNQKVLTGNEIDNIAVKIHGFFQQKFHGPNNKEWSQLEEEIRDSNRNAAIHWEIKKRVLQYFRPGESWDQILNNCIPSEQLEILAQMEHRRWYAEKILAGYVYAEKRDDQRLEHPCLVDWDELPEKEKEKDRDAIKNLLEWEKQRV